MSPTRYVSATLLNAAVITVCLLSTAVSRAETDYYRVGAATALVTPPVGHWLAGYSRARAVTGVLDDLYAKAVVIGDGETRIALVTLDSIGLTRPDIDQIEAQLALRLPGFPVHQLVVSSTHTHAGPDVVGLWGESLWRSGRDADYMDVLVEKVVQAVVQADRVKRRAISRVGSLEMVMDWVENRSEPELIDQRLSVLQFIDEEGRSIATLTNFACHPTVLDGDNTQVSGDYVSGFYAAMASSLPGEHLFLQGAIGGWVQPIAGAASHARAQTLGAQVAKAALNTIDKSVGNPFRPLLMRSKTFDVPLDNWGFTLMMWLGVLERDTFDGAMRTRASWLKIGDAEFVTHPGETSPAYSFASRKLMSTKHGFVLGLSQDAMGYILKPAYFSEDAVYPHAEYLQSVSVGPEAGPRLMQVLTELTAAESSCGTNSANSGLTTRC